MLQAFPNAWTRPLPATPSVVLKGCNPPDLWLLGHAHDASDLAVGRIVLRCVSLGYSDEVEIVAAAPDSIGRGMLEV